MSAEADGGADGGTVAAVVLAAGMSTRMGRNKLLLQLEGEPVVRRAARRAAAAGLDPVVVVTGHERERVEAALAGSGGAAECDASRPTAQPGGRWRLAGVGAPCRTVHNPDYAEGQHTSVRTGIAALDKHCRAAVVVLADMPFVTVRMLRALAARHEPGSGLGDDDRARLPAGSARGAGCRRVSRPRLVVSRYGPEAVVAPPILYDRSLFGELARLDSRCGRRVVKRRWSEVVVVDLPAAALRDLDAPADYEGARAAIRMRGRARTAVSVSASGAREPSERWRG